jgi:type IV fimbrial biogenesis protein FimT
VELANKIGNIMNIKNNKGFNLVELMIVLVIMSSLMVVAAPMYSAWLTNMRVKNIAEGINLGITQARAEAIRRNQHIFFVLNNDTSWEIKNVDDEVINRKASSESSTGVALTIAPNGSDIITFNGYGSLTPNTDASESVSSIVVNSAITMSGVNPITVKIGNGGGTLVCTSDCADQTTN